MSQFSIICAIEAGRLEAQTLLMLTTLKQFGGALGQSRIVAFQGRRGEKISIGTRRRLADMDVEYVYDTALNKAPWFNYTNKIAALRYAQDTFTTPWRVWLDSDILFLDEPDFAQGTTLDGSDFQARFEYLPPAFGETDETHLAYWSQACALCDVAFEDIGFHDLDLPPKRMKPYFNSGMFLWRGATDFAQTYERNYYRILAARIAPKGIGPWFADQVSLTPTVQALNLNWRMLPPQDHLMLFDVANAAAGAHARISDASLVHYSKARNLPQRTLFDPLVIARRPALAEMFQTFDSYPDQAGIGVINRARNTLRRLRQAAYKRRCTEL